MLAHTAQQPAALQPETVAESHQRLAADRSGHPYIRRHQDDHGWRLRILPPEVTRVTVGRDPTCDVHLTADARASRMHVELLRLGFDWVLLDEGLSRNGTWINGMRRLRRGADV